MSEGPVNGNGRRDVLVTVPAAFGSRRGDMPGSTFEPPSPKEMAEWLAARNRELETELAALRMTAGTIANVACALVQERLDRGDAREGDDAIVIPKALSERMKGARISLREIPAGVAVRINERQEFPVEIEGG